MSQLPEILLKLFLRYCSQVEVTVFGIVHPFIKLLIWCSYLDIHSMSRNGRWRSWHERSSSCGGVEEPVMLKLWKA